MTKFSYALVLLTFFVVGCSDTKQLSINEINSLVDSGDTNLAVIELKGLIAENPQNGKLRALLGELYQKQGDAQSAAKELQKAIDFGEHDSKVEKALLKSYLLLVSHEDIGIYLNRYGHQAKSEYVELYTSIFNFLSSTPVTSEQEPSKIKILTEAYDNAALGNCMEAIDLAERQIPKLEYNLEIGFLIANCSSSENAFEKAFMTYASLYNDFPKSTYIALNLINTAYYAGHIEEVRDTLDLLTEKLPNNVIVLQINGMLAFDNEQYNTAFENLSSSIQRGLDKPLARIKASLSAYRLKNYETAYEFITPLKPIAKDINGLQKLISAQELTLGYTNEAARSLSNTNLDTQTDFNLFLKAAKETDSETSPELYRSLINTLSESSLNTQGTRYKLGLLKLSKGDYSGVSDLIESELNNEDATLGTIALIQYYLTSDEPEKATPLINTLINEDNTRHVGLTIWASIDIAKRDYGSALNSLEDALAHAPTYEPALLQKARLFVSQSKLEEAKTIINSLLDSRIATKAVQLTLANQEKLGKVFIEEMFTTLEETGNNTLTTDILAAQYYLAKSTPRLSYDFLTPYLETNSKITNSNFWLTLVAAASKVEDTQKALLIGKKWLNADEESELAHIVYLNLLASSTDKHKELPLAKKSHLKFEDSEAVTLAYSNLMLMSNEIKNADKLYNSLSDETKQLPQAELVGGLISFYKKDYVTSERLLSKAYKNFKSGLIARTLFISKLNLNKKTSAIEQMKHHIEAYPKDVSSIITVANFALSEQPKWADELYTKVLSLEQDNLIALNNLAWLKTENNELSEAKHLIDEGLMLYPNSPQLNNTAGHYFMKIGDFEKSRSFFKKAITLSPSHVEYKKDLDKLDFNTST